MLLCFADLASLGPSFAGLSFPGSFPSFLEMLGLGDFDAPLDSVTLISLIECISRALTVAASRLLWDNFRFLGVPSSRGPSPSLVFAFAFLSWFLWDSSTFFRVLLQPFCGLILCPGLSGATFYSVRVQAFLSPSPPLVCFCFSVLVSLGQLLSS